ncbi:MAG: CoA pyrophosphatase [Microbacteriaceae bacterium]
MPAADPRAELEALCERGLDWHPDMSRLQLDLAGARHAAVLVLFGVLDSIPARVRSDVPGTVASDLDVLLLRRAATLDHHPGQIAFPGGRLDATDAGPIQAALREAVEETGLEPDGLEPLGVLPTLAVPVSNHVVTPVLAWWRYPSRVAAVDHAETVEVFRVPVADLLDPGNRASTTHVIDGDTLTAPAFLVGDRLIWGFTAIVLSRIFEELDWAVPWDHTRIVQAGT